MFKTNGETSMKKSVSAGVTRRDFVTAAMALTAGIPAGVKAQDRKSVV